VAASDVAEFDVLVIGGTFREVIERSQSNPVVRLGGSALTAAIAAARMGAAVALSTFVGAEDEDPARMLLSHAGVRTDLVILPGASGTFVYPAGSEDTNPRPLYRPAETSPLAFPPLPRAAAVLIFGMPDFDPPRDPAVIDVAQQAGSVLWDRQGWMSRTRDASAIASLDVGRTTGVVTLPPGFEAAILKDGRRGAMIADVVGGRTLIPAYPVDVPNNVGSGDVFAGVVAAEVSRGACLETATSFAAAATSAVLSARDTIAPPDLRELAEVVMRTKQSSGSSAWRW
jgi:sugar/nucleoside kinase (ribokinase family)